MLNPYSKFIFVSRFGADTNILTIEQFDTSFDTRFECDKNRPIFPVESSGGADISWWRRQVVKQV